VLMKFRFLIFFFLILTVSFSATAQSTKQLQQKRKELQKEIKKINSLLFKSKKESEALLSLLGDLNKKISVRTKLIRTIVKESETLSKEIAKNEIQKETLEKELETLKKDYANMIVKSYKSKNNQSRLMFLLSSENFTQAYKRLQYMKQYTSYRKLQGEKIKNTTLDLTILTDSLVIIKDEKQELISLHLREKDSVKNEKSIQERLVGKVKSKEKKYRAKIKKIQDEERLIDRKIQRLIAAAIAKSNKNSNTKSSKFKLTPEAKKLESTFIANKGKLFWPTQKGLVVRRFGKQKHPTLAGITVQSNGIRIATEKKAKARAVFNGKVMSIQLLPGRKKLVLIQHGNYITSYQNLDNVLVKEGQHISTKQEIGTIHTDAVTGKTILIFGLYKGKFINPEPWIGKMI